MICLAPRCILICLLLSIVVSVVTSLFTIPNKSNCEKNVRYWIKYKFKFFEFKHWNNFIECFEKVSIDEAYKNDPELIPYINNKEPILALKDVIQERDFCHGEKAQLMVDYGERFVKPYENLHWDENVNSDLIGDASNVPELIKEPSIVDTDCEDDKSISIDSGNIKCDVDIQTEVDGKANISTLLQPFKKMYYGYVGQVAKTCMARMQRRALKILEQKPELFTKRKVDSDLVEGQEELCNLAGVEHDPSSKKNQCYQKLTASHLAALFPPNSSDDHKEDTAQSTTINAFLAKIDAYLRKNQLKNIKPNFDADSKEETDAYKEAADKLARSCAVLKSFYDAVISPTTVFASAGYVIDSADIVKRAKKDKSLAKWLAIQRLCDLVLRIKLEQHITSEGEDELAMDRKNEYRLHLDFAKKIRGDERFTIIVFDHIDYIRCRGKKNSLCGFIYIHPKRSIVIAIVIGIVISGLTAGIGAAVTLLISGAAIKLSTLIAGATAGIHHAAAVSSGGAAFSMPDISGLSTALAGLGG